MIKIVSKNVNMPTAWLGLDSGNKLWLFNDSRPSEREWEPIPFNEMYKGYYPTCRFTAVGATDRDFVVAGIGQDGVPYVFRSLRGGVWDCVNLLSGNQLSGYKRADSPIIDILYDEKTRQLFMPCENGELLTIPDCPKCAKLQRVTQEKLVSGSFSKENPNIIILTTITGEEVQISLDEAVQMRISREYAETKIKQGGILVDLRKINIDDVGEWLSMQPKDKFIAFLCNYGVQADRAAEYARNNGYYEAYSLGGEMTNLYEYSQ